MREFFVNADFDLSLRKGRDPSTVDARVRQAGELPLHQLFLGIGGDTILVEEEPEKAFLDYVGRLSLPVPVWCLQPERTRRAVFAPFGWNEEAVGLNRGYDEPAAHPPLEVVRRVNGRSWSAALERELSDDGVGVGLGVAHSLEELETLIHKRPADEHEWIVKSEHGNSGLGNRRLRGRELEAADLKVVRRLLAEDECLHVERWCRRTVDLVTTFTVDESGNTEDCLFYEAVNTADGAFIGDIFDRSSPSVDRWRPELADTASVVSKKLAVEGYFGPVCLDAFVWNDSGRDRLRVLVEVNARSQMAAAAIRLWGSWGRRPVVYWRLFSSRRLNLPERFEDFVTALGSDAFDPAGCNGVLLTSPLRFSGRRPRRIGVLMAGNDRASVEGLDHRFRKSFER